MAENSSYKDRLFNEIAEWSNRAKSTLTEPDRLLFLNKIIQNWTTPYETPERQQEASRLAAQQTKEQYMAQQNAGQLSLEDAIESQAIREGIGRQIHYFKPDTAYLAEQERLRMQAAKEGYMAQQEAAKPTEQYEQPSIPGLEDPYAQYLQENREVLKSPEYAAPTREEYQKYFVEGQAPAKAVLSQPASAGMEMPVAQQAQPSAIPALAEVPEEAIPAQQPSQQRPMTIRDRIAALPYEADRLDATRRVIDQARTKAFNDGLRRIAQTYGDLGLPNAENARKALEKSIDVNLPLPKPIEETAQYKSAEKNWDGGLREARKRISYNIAQAQKAQELMDIDPRAALIHMRSNLIKPLNSILSNDAIQLSEMIVRYPDLLSGAEMSQLGGKKLLNPTTIATKFLSLDEKVQEDIVKKFTSAFAEANPQRFLETAINGINGYVSSFNRDINDQVIAPTSPNIAKQLGATFLEPLQHRQPKSDVQVVRPGQAAQQPASVITPEAAAAELERRRAARQSQQKDMTGKQAF